jgi:ribosome maturation factor RimP
MTSPHDKEKQLYREISHTVPAAVPGVEVLATELTGREGMRVYVDHPQGVDHALCARVSEVLQPYLEQYSVEVSSPGFDRPLRTREHFERAVGKQVKLKVGARRLRGEVVSAGARSFQFEATQGKNGAAVPADIPYEDIVRANLIDEG